LVVGFRWHRIQGKMLYECHQEVNESMAAEIHLIWSQDSPGSGGKAKRVVWQQRCKGL
jgi:hypothetical protein